MITPPDPCGAEESPSGKTPPPLSPEAVEHRRLIAENDALILSPDLDNGLAIVTARTAIFTRAIAQWAAEQQAAFGFTRPFAVAAIGGTGRGEVTPCSDLDIAFLSEDDVEKDPAVRLTCRAFVIDLQNRTINSSEFRDRFGFRFTVMPYGMSDVPDLRDICPRENASIRSGSSETPVIRTRNLRTSSWTSVVISSRAFIATMLSDLLPISCGSQNQVPAEDRRRCQLLGSGCARHTSFPLRTGGSLSIFSISLRRIGRASPMPRHRIVNWDVSLKRRWG